MKKTIYLLCMAAGLLSCAKVGVTPQEENVQYVGTPMTFNITVTETKADKTDWEDGDKIYVFFNGLWNRYLILEYDYYNWTCTNTSSTGGPLLDTDFASLETKTLTAVHIPASVNIVYDSDEKVFLFFKDFKEYKPFYTFYLYETGKEYTVSGTTVTASLELGKPEGMVQIHVAGIQEFVEDYTFSSPNIQPIACAGVGVDGSIKESSLQAGTRISGIADSDGGIFAGRLTKGEEASNYVFTVATNEKIYTLTRENKALSPGKIYNFPALNVTGGTNWTVTKAEDLCVDLGITVDGKTVYWAKCNLGATSETDYGDYFAWGEVTGYNEGKTSFEWSTYYFSDSYLLTKYCPEAEYGQNGYTDDLTVLLPEDDAAYAALGGLFHIPTMKEWIALFNSRSDTANYTWTWCDGETTKYQDSNAQGWKIVRNSTSATLFLPYSEYNPGFIDRQPCKYWSSSLSYEGYSYPDHACCMRLENTATGCRNDLEERCNGLPIRPVIAISPASGGDFPGFGEEDI